MILFVPGGMRTAVVGAGPSELVGLWDAESVASAPMDAHREVVVVLCTPDGELLGELPPVVIPAGWWRDVEDLVSAVWRAFGVRARILRILRMPDGDAGRGRYLAETDTIPAEVSLHPSDDDPLAEEPRRLRYAQPGGHRTDLGWAWETLRRNGITPLGSPIQVRTWNLSSIWRFSTSAGTVWLKATPAFCDVEARLLPVLDPGVVPEVFGADSGRVLLADVHGTDQYEANLVTRCGFIGLLVGLQQQWIGRVKELEALALNDYRAAPAIAAIESTIDREVGALDPEERRRLTRLVDGLPRRFAALEACGVPETLVHADFHPGNVRGESGDYRILDWADSAIGNPLLDLRPTLEYLSGAERAEVVEAFVTGWQRTLPGCDARRAAELAAPLGPLLGAVTYRRFLDNIEPSERPYHDGDPARALRRAIEITDVATTLA